jgi:hypothetical protein
MILAEIGSPTSPCARISPNSLKFSMAPIPMRRFERLVLMVCASVRRVPAHPSFCSRQFRLGLGAHTVRCPYPEPLVRHANGLLPRITEATMRWRGGGKHGPSSANRPKVFIRGN